MSSKIKLSIVLFYFIIFQILLYSQQFNLKYSVEKRIDLILDIDGDGVCEYIADTNKVYDFTNNNLKYSFPAGEVVNDDDFVALTPKIHFPHIDFNNDGKRELIIETEDYDQKVIVYDLYNNNTLFEFSNPSRNTYFKYLMDVDGDNELEIIVDEIFWLPNEQYDHYKTLIYSTSVVSSSKNVNNNIPDKYKLNQNYPNPFNPSTTIEYEITKPDNVKINIYDVTGRLVKELVKEQKNTGKYSTVWNGKDNFGNMVASGNYFYQIISGDFVQAKKMILLK
jgi:hypothetical protein